VAIRGLNAGTVVVYDASGARLRNITNSYGRTAATALDSRLSRYVDVGNALFASQLGTGWYDLEEAHRWMGKTATLHIGGPESATQELYLSGGVPAELTGHAPLVLKISLDGEALPALYIPQGAESFELSTPVPPRFIHKDDVTVTIDVDRTFTPPGDGRALSLAFGKISIH
jgi:hypothetical protein